MAATLSIPTQPPDPIADAGRATATAGQTFQGPETTVQLGVPIKPRKIPFDPTPPEIKKGTKPIPAELAGRTIPSAANMTLAQAAEEFNVYQIKILRNIIGPHGKPLFCGDIVDYPGNVCMWLVGDNSAEFVMAGRFAEEQAFLDQGKKKFGFDLKPQPVPVEQRREELKKRKSSWLKDTFDPRLGQTPIGN